MPYINQKILESKVYSPASITKELLSDNLIEDSEYDAVRRFIHRYISVPYELEDLQEDNIVQSSNFIENKINKITENMRIKSSSKYIESSILVIPDLHLPFILPNFLEHCISVRNKFKCKHIIFIGDILDNHYSSYHETNPNGYSALQELELAIEHLKLWVEYFQDAIVIKGNHDVLPTRKAITSGLANRWIRPFKEVLDTPNWEFLDEYELQDIIFTHGHLTKEAFQECLLRQKPVVSGHRHGKCYIKYQTNKLWGMQVGIGFDKTKYAFNYAGNTTTWVENVAVIFDRVPILQPFRK